jgi:hypothetical protein
MTILKVMVDDDQADELKRLLHDISFVKSVVEEQIQTDESNVTYNRIKKILDSAKGKELFKDIKDPVKWQKEIRKEWERDF